MRATFYVWSGNEIIAEYDESGQMLYQYAYANGVRIAQLKKTGSATKDTTYLHSDYQGSTRLQTDRVKTVTARIDYDIWGQVRQQTGLPSAYTYTGQEWDDENGMNLFYLNARYYDPAIGRFTTPDPLPSDLNPYSYCNNNPAMLTDVSGMHPDFDGRDGSTPGSPNNPIPAPGQTANGNGPSTGSSKGSGYGGNPFNSGTSVLGGASSGSNYYHNPGEEFQLRLDKPTPDATAVRMPTPEEVLERVLKVSAKKAIDREVDRMYGTLRRIRYEEDLKHRTGRLPSHWECDQQGRPHWHSDMPTGPKKVLKGYLENPERQAAEKYYRQYEDSVKEDENSWEWRVDTVYHWR